LIFFIYNLQKSAFFMFSLVNLLCNLQKPDFLTN
jgi:hypothetical protein